MDIRCLVCVASLSFAGTFQMNIRLSNSIHNAALHSVNLNIDYGMEWNFFLIHQKLMKSTNTQRLNKDNCIFISS